ncbi:hypothetical protein OIDMADRAFT_60958 [Oidiodendron maius Zn]|uniref:Peptidase S9 prolyl oligopeptidase catalytic domain-containing protein n=1 Tax=Oidiodendron maius (strain Zn) TaxID=913774 RepID=A0A0C3GS68_OIDMZ|nr:hypothetical protein OIDMADRAFT_60958 [Oidiodendron maius Zn]
MFFETAITFLALIRATNTAARAFGAKLFLPALSARRFSSLAGIDEATMARQMKACTSFSDANWTSYWSGIALQHIDRLDKQLDYPRLGRAREWVERGAVNTPPSDLNCILSRGGAAITRTPFGRVIDLNELNHGITAEVESGLAAVDALLKAIVYLFVASWPGRSPKRDEAYYTSGRLFDVLLDAITPTMGLEVERHIVLSGDESISIYFLLPDASLRDADKPWPAILVSNGLEGTNLEAMLYFLYNMKHRSNFAWVFMEMPGTYAYKNPMKVGISEQVYSDVISKITTHPTIDRNRVGMLGLSFGAHWATRMAFADERLKAVAANGPPLARSLQPWGAFGIPQIMIDTLCNVSGASSLFDLSVKLHALSPKRSDIERISCPILAFNGDKDTLVSTQDTVDLAKWAPNSRLHMYPNDDHCAMSHAQEWIELCMSFFQAHLQKSEAS